MASSRGATVGISEVFWDRLLLLMEEGRVVPVVGPDLLTVDRDGVSFSLNARLAERLAEYLDIPAAELPPGDELNAVACRYMASGRQNRQMVYSALKTIWSREAEPPVPQALRHLAEIRAFSLFVSTTFDPLLERALNDLRYGGQADTRVLAYAPDERQDLPPGPEPPGTSTLYHLFGRLSARPAYVVTQEDTLEFVHSLQSEQHQPEHLFERLNQSNLLILGSDMGGWLARFFMRMSRRERLLGARNTTDFVVGLRTQEDPGLIFFLQNLTTGIEVLQESDAAEFIHELHTRWFERHPAGVEDRTPRPTTSLPSGGGPNAVFLSYASQDLAVARRIKEGLEAKVDVFFDREDLRSGDNWDAKLVRCIQSSSVFVPVLSRNTLTSDRRYVRAEWYEAIKEARKELRTSPFIHPVIIDDVSLQDPDFPEKFASTHATWLDDGRLPPEFVDRIVELHRRAQER